MKIISWWSAGVTSAVATKIALEIYNPDDVDIVYIETGAAHEDNPRFIEDCEKWYGKRIKIIRNKKGYISPLDVGYTLRYINGAAGARCSQELKKNVRIEYCKGLDFKYDHHIMGFEFTEKEINRAIRFKQQYPELSPLYPLIDKKLDKKNCLYLLKQQNIETPEMYKLGYLNNNCIGCFKGGMAYWNRIRKDFPDVFDDVAELERELNATCVTTKIMEGKKCIGRQRVFLDELDPSRGRNEKPIIPECGIMCQIEFAEIIDHNTEKVYSGDTNINDI